MGREDAWYWSPEWQAWEQEADEDLEIGRYDVFESMDDLILSLNPHFIKAASMIAHALEETEIDFSKVKEAKELP